MTGWPVAGACLLAWRLGELSQQWAPPHSWQVRVYPPRADLHALVALASLGLFHALDGVDVGATSIRHVRRRVASGRRGANHRFHSTAPDLGRRMMKCRGDEDAAVLRAAGESL
jgi:hypothetical protein